MQEIITMKNRQEIADRIAQEKERLQDLIDEPYNPRQPQLTNIFCITSYIDALKWVLHDT